MRGGVAMSKANRDKAAEKAVKARIQKTHLRSFRVVGSDTSGEDTFVYMIPTIFLALFLSRIGKSSAITESIILSQQALRL